MIMANWTPIYYLHNCVLACKYTVEYPEYIIMQSYFEITI